MIYPDTLYYILFSAECILLFSSHSVMSDCEPMDYSPPGSSVHGISHARILQWVQTPERNE